MKCLKFVGLSYDPFSDCLAASTRKGSVLPMQIDSIGLLSKEAKTVEYFVADSARNDLAMPDISVCPIEMNPERLHFRKS
ncbi:MAG TPA: hypothetical protein VEP90_20900 [Methylomirabilota bacterium]|nr:hypothetical protein [Methylomirabilota bacterium]